MVKLNLAITSKDDQLIELKRHQTANIDAGTDHPLAPAAAIAPAAGLPARTKAYPKSVSDQFKSKLPKYDALTFAPECMTTYFALCNGELQRRITETTKKLEALKLTLAAVKASLTDTLNKSYRNSLALAEEAAPMNDFCDDNSNEIKALIIQECAAISVAYYQTQHTQSVQSQKKKEALLAAKLIAETPVTMTQGDLDRINRSLTSKEQKRSGTKRKPKVSPRQAYKEKTDFQQSKKNGAGKRNKAANVRKLKK